MKKEEFKKYKLPENPGVYFFLDKKHNKKSLPDKKNILYIGKATSLKDRVGSYFSKDLIKTRGLKLTSCIENTKDIFFIEALNVFEAIILESKYIKEYKPFFNTKEKDDKSYSYVVVIKEKYPRVLIMRGRELEKDKDLFIFKKFGPFVSKSELIEVMKILRRLFPYRDKCKIGEDRGCFNFQIGLCPGVCVGYISEEKYKKNILSIEKILNGDIKKLSKELEKEMNISAKNKEFEKAGKLRDILFNLKNIKDINLVKNENINLENRDYIYKIESYDVAHISGSHRVGVMCKFEIINNELDYKKSEYKKFKLTEKVNDDIKGLQEILSRRFSHTEWDYPDFVVIDGGETHLKFAKDIISKFENTKNIKILSIVKDQKHKAREILFDIDVEKFIEKNIKNLNNKNFILANEEAHRFAISYHKLLRNKIKNSIK